MKRVIATAGETWVAGRAITIVILVGIVIGRPSRSISGPERQDYRDRSIESNLVSLLHIFFLLHWPGSFQTVYTNTDAMSTKRPGQERRTRGEERILTTRKVLVTWEKAASVGPAPTKGRDLLLKGELGLKQWALPIASYRSLGII
jgi:hypothetical protein